MNNNKIRKPNIVRGGIAVPLGRNYYYMRGRKHEQGGIDIGKNPRTGLEVENGEVMHVGSKDIKVYSSLPFLNGKSPAQRVMSGENPNKVFNAQESYKRRNRINDDGTKKKARKGGLYTLSVNGKQSLRPYPSTGEIKLSQRQELTGTTIMKCGGRKRKALGGDDKYNPWDYEYYKRHRIASDPLVAGAFIGGNIFNNNTNKTKNTTVSKTTTPINNASTNNTPKTTSQTAPASNTKVQTTRTTTSKTTTPKTTVTKTTTPTVTTTPKTASNNTIRNNNTIRTTTNRKNNNRRTTTNNKVTKNNLTINPIQPANIVIPSLVDTLPKVTDIPKSPIDYTPLPVYPTYASSRNRFRQFLKDNPETVTDAIGLASNIGSSLIGMGLTNHALNQMRYSSQPIPERAAKLKTRININPQLDRMRESLAAYERNIDENTGSSQVALARKQRARLADVLGRNELYADKENKETELINTDRLNQQEVANRNIESYNTWSAGKAAFENSIAEQKANNRIAAINNINAGVQQVVGNIQQRMADNRTMTALTFGSPNLPAEMFYGAGIWNKRLYDLYRRSYPLKRK